MVNEECRRAGIGCVQCKQLLAKNLNVNLQPFRDRRTKLSEDPQMVWDVLDDGRQRAGAIAKDTILQVKSAIGLP